MIYTEQDYQRLGMTNDNGHYYNIAAIIKEMSIASVLDVGCGYGHVVKHLRNSGVIADGIDPSEAAVKAASTQHIEQVSFEAVKGHYELILVNEVVQEFDEQQLSSFIKWLGSVTRRVLILNDEVKYPRKYTSAFLKLAFFAEGWYLDFEQEKLLKAQNCSWNYLALKRSFGALGAPGIRTNSSITVAIDCYSDQACITRTLVELTLTVTMGIQVVLVNYDPQRFPRMKLTHVSGNEHTLSFQGWNIPVTVATGMKRSVRQSYANALEYASGGAFCYVQAGTTFSDSFFLLGIRELLNKDGVDLIIPSTFLMMDSQSSLIYPSDSKLIFQIFEQFNRPLMSLGRTLDWCVSWNPKGSSYRPKQRICPVFIARIEKLRQLTYHEELILGAEEVFLRASQTKKVVAIDQSVTIPPHHDSRFADSEVQAEISKFNQKNWS